MHSSGPGASVISAFRGAKPVGSHAFVSDPRCVDAQFPTTMTATRNAIVATDDETGVYGLFLDRCHITGSQLTRSSLFRGLSVGHQNTSQMVS
jgi:hypothetical protein